MERRGVRAAVLFTGAALLAPLGLRGFLIAQKLGLPGIGDIGGVLSDLAVAAVFAAGLILLSKGSRFATALALAVWGLLHYANYENALALDALAAAEDVRFLGNETFLRGSALWISNPFLLAGVVAGGGLLGWWLAAREARTQARAAGVTALAGLLLFGVHAGWMFDRLPIGWRYADFLQVNASRAIASAVRSVPERGSASFAMAERLPELLADLDGEPITSLGHSGRNVLLVFVESISGGYLPDNVAAHRTLEGPRMERLQEIARRGLSYQTFIAHQRRTNRGLYAGLCGDLPNLLLGLAKMTAYIDGGTRVCLPHVLRSAGYKTVYLQAAPLAFMLKDQFMPRAGFDEVYGNDWFETAYVRSVWGIDDRSYFEQSLKMVDRLEREEGPWFLTLLTVGTHHPTILPTDFEPEKPVRFSRAISYADQAIQAFVHALGERGILDDTLILITSDESRGIPANRDKTTASLTQNWGFLIALLPEKTQRAIREPFALMDIPISILDYLGLAGRGKHFFGRSAFRSYAEGRYLFFANTYLKFVGALAPDGALLFCPSGISGIPGMTGCRRYTLPEGRLFSSQRTDAPWDDGDDGDVGDDGPGNVLRDIARLSVDVQKSGVQPRVYELVATPRVKVQQRNYALIHGGQFIDLKKNQWLDVEIEFDATGGRHPVEFEHSIHIADDTKKRFFIKVRPGETLKFRYTYLASRDLRVTHCRSFARLSGGAPMELSFRHARMTVHTVGPRPSPGFVIQRRDTARTSPP